MTEIKKVWLVLTKNHDDHLGWVGWVGRDSEFFDSEIKKGVKLIILDGSRSKYPSVADIIGKLNKLAELANIRVWIHFGGNEMVHCFDPAKFAERMKYYLSDDQEYAAEVLSQEEFAPYSLKGENKTDYQEEMLDVRWKVNEAIRFGKADLSWLDDEFERLWKMTVPHRKKAQKAELHKSQTGRG